jgi:gas vesicle protein
MNSSRPEKLKRPGTDRRWTLLFIGDHGNVVTLKRFKAIVLGAGFLFLVAIGAVAVLLFMHQRALDENQGFRSRIENFQKKIDTLRHEKEILMARLVLAESKAKENTPKQLQSKADSNTEDQRTAESEPESKTEAREVTGKKPSVASATPPKPVLPEARDAEPEFSVTVENFKISRVSGSADVNAEFRIKNTGPQSQKVSGHAVVVLKGNEIPKHKWLVMPAVSMVGDRPSGKRGKRFSIQRFRTMRFTFRAPGDTGEFQTAAVYIFLKTGELVLQQDFPVDLPPSRASLTETPAAQTPSAETSSEVTPSLKMLLRGTPPEDKPSVETPAIDEPLDNL